MSDRKTLNEIYTDVLTDGGIFHDLQSLSVPWQDDNMADSLDLAYHGMRSGSKPIGPLVALMLDSDGELSSTNRAKIAAMLWDIYGDKWTKLWATLSYQYDPISNYDMTEIMTDDETVKEYGHTSTRTDDLSHAKTGTENRALTDNNTRTNNLTDGRTDTTYGFNSSDAVNSAGATLTHTGTVADVGTGSDNTTYNTTDRNTGTQDMEEGGSDTSTRNYTLTRSGNIGVTTTQQMIEQERNLLFYNYFYDTIFSDIDRYLVLSIY